MHRPAVYWHMLPQKEQARKAIWTSVNPHTGRRRVDEAFPHEIRKRTLEHEMMIEFVNGSVWQVVGSDNFNSLVGAALGGIVYSEWALANPAARAYLRPIIAESRGWQIFITTPRGVTRCQNQRSPQPPGQHPGKPGSILHLQLPTIGICGNGF